MILSSQQLNNSLDNSDKEEKNIINNNNNKFCKLYCNNIPSKFLGKKCLRVNLNKADEEEALDIEQTDYEEVEKLAHHKQYNIEDPNNQEEQSSHSNHKNLELEENKFKKNTIIMNEPINTNTNINKYINNNRNDIIFEDENEKKINLHKNKIENTESNININTMDLMGAVKDTAIEERRTKPKQKVKNYKNDFNFENSSDNIDDIYQFDCLSPIVLSGKESFEEKFIQKNDLQLDNNLSDTITNFKKAENIILNHDSKNIILNTYSTNNTCNKTEQNNALNINTESIYTQIVNEKLRKKQKGIGAVKSFFTHNNDKHEINTIKSIDDSTSVSTQFTKDKTVKTVKTDFTEKISTTKNNQLITALKYTKTGFNNNSLFLNSEQNVCLNYNKKNKQNDIINNINITNNLNSSGNHFNTNRKNKYFSLERDEIYLSGDNRPQNDSNSKLSGKISNHNNSRKSPKKVYFKNIEEKHNLNEVMYLIEEVRELESEDSNINLPNKNDYINGSCKNILDKNIINTSFQTNSHKDKAIKSMPININNGIYDHLGAMKFDLKSGETYNNLLATAKFFDLDS